MTIAVHPTRELAEIRNEITRLKAREKSLRAIAQTRRLASQAHSADVMIERQLRRVFRQPRLLAGFGV